MKLDIKITVIPDDTYSPSAKAEASIQASALSAETIANLARIAADDVAAQLGQAQLKAEQEDIAARTAAASAA